MCPPAGPPKKSAQTAGVQPAVCPFCGRPIDPGKGFVICPRPECLTPYHPECWKDNGDRCSMAHCGGAGELRAIHLAPGSPSASKERKSQPLPPCPACGRALPPEMAVCTFCRLVVRPALIWVRSDRTYYDLPLHPDRIVHIGRDGANDLVIPVQQVSRRHALIWRDSQDHCYYVQDRGSKNGTWVDGVAVPTNSTAQVPQNGSINISQEVVLYLCEPGQVLPPGAEQRRKV